MNIGRLLLRTTVGGLFVGHGLQKLCGWFGGGGLAATSQSFEKRGIRPGRANAIVAGSAEVAGGTGFVLGFAMPLAASMLTATMLTAIHRVTLENGPWLVNHGYEYNAVLLAAAIALAEVGPGEPSLDHALRQDRTGPRWAAAALSAGIVGAIGAYVVAELQPPTEPTAGVSASRHRAP